MVGNRKKCVKKEQNSRFSALFGGVLLELVYGIIILDFEKIAFFDSEAIFGPFAAPGKSFLT